MPTDSDSLALDAYALTMVQGYLDRGMTDTAVFEFFVRDQSRHRNFLVAAGIDWLLEELEQLRFPGEEVDWVWRQPQFGKELRDWLRDFRFTGEAHAMAEGTFFFPDEPVLRVTAPLPEAQLIEARVINRLHFQTLIASKAVRCVLAAPGKQLVDFGLRRAHGLEAGLLAARASYLAGFAGTSNVAAGRRFGIPFYGTMAHAFVQAHEHERDAFLDFAAANPDNVVFILDTYDTETAARTVVDLAPVLKRQGMAIRGVRLDSGNLAELAHRVRAILDAGGLKDTRILASGDLDEFALEKLCSSGAPIDGFGVGTNLTTSKDVPGLNCAYKLQAYAGRPCRKASTGKGTWPGAKQVYRLLADDNRLTRDIVDLQESSPADGQPLLEHRMNRGKRLAPPRALSEIRKHVQAQLKQLPDRLRSLPRAQPYPVEIADALKRLAEELDAERAPRNSDAPPEQSQEPDTVQTRLAGGIA